MNHTSFATLYFALAICCLTITHTTILEAQTLRNLFFNSNENVVQLDFSTEPPTVLGTGTQGSLEGIVHYEDDNGNLLFWFNTDASAIGSVYNQNGDKMLGSDGIFADNSSTEICVAPSPSNSSQYYLLYNAANCTKLYYAIVDMSLNGGLGDVIALNTVISDNNFSEGIEVIAIPQTDDYWLVTYQCNVGFTRFLIDENGVGSGTVFHNFATPGGYQGRGELDYHKGYFGAAFDGSNQVVMGSFDPTTGNSCNETTLIGNNGNLGVSFNTKPYGIEFSPSANKMYITLWQTNTIDFVYQYDIENATIAGFAPTLDLDNIINGNVTIGQVELGRDGRLYIIEYGGTNILSIDNPDDDVPIFNLIPVPATTNLGITDHIQSHIFQDETYVGESICLNIGESAMLTPQNTEVMYSWANINDTSIELAEANTFEVEATSEVQQFVAVPVDGCTNELEYFVYPTPSDISAGLDQNIALGQSVVLAASTSISVENVLWFPIDGLDDPNSLTPTASPTETTTYTLSLQNGPCQVQDEVTVFVFEDGVINETHCVNFGQTYELSMPDTLLNPSWTSQNEPNVVLSNAHNFTITISDEIVTYVGNGDNPNAPNGVLSQITLIPQPNLNAGNDMVITAGDVVELNATGGGSSGYSWAENATLSDITINNPMATPTETTTYYVTSNYGDAQCEAMDSVRLVVINTQDAVQQEICAIVGEAISLSVNEGDFSEINWRDANEPTTIIATGDSYEAIGQATTTAYFATAQDDFGNITIFSFTIYPNPTISVGNDLTILEGENITLEAIGGDNYSWQPADLLFDANSANPTTNITETTLFTVTNTTENNCNFSTEITVNVESESFALIPSGFSPNNDGVNDILNILPFNVSELITFEIYDRWGKMIYQTNDITAGWNGEIKNRTADMGVYVYFVSLVAKDGTPYAQKGNVTLVR